MRKRRLDILIDRFVDKLVDGKKKSGWLTDEVLRQSIIDELEKETEKQTLIDGLLKNPIKFYPKNPQKSPSNPHLDRLKELITFEDLRKMVKRIYDINEDKLVETSSANEGLIGKLNRESNKCRYKKFVKKINNQLAGEKYYKIYAEGDSWFQYPTTLKDTIDWLNKRPDFIIYAEASGGDWITNMIYEGQYVSGLSMFSPEIFLISGGGNDILGNNRLAFMVDGKCACKSRRYESVNDIKSPCVMPEHLMEFGQKEDIAQNIFYAQKFLTKEFYAMMLVFKLQYFKMFEGLYKKKCSTKKDVISITQGYDYGIPDFGRSPWNNPFHGRWIWNFFHRRWLFTPLMMKGIKKEEDQKAVILAMIHELNEIMGSFALNYKNVFHIDNRGVAKSEKDWHNEIHLTGDNYKKVAKAYEYVIRNYRKLREENKKIIRTTDVPV